jgi:hypothetical protein
MDDEYTLYDMVMNELARIDTQMDYYVKSKCDDARLFEIFVLGITEIDEWMIAEGAPKGVNAFPEIREEYYRVLSRAARLAYNRVVKENNKS